MSSPKGGAILHSLEPKLLESIACKANGLQRVLLLLLWCGLQPLLSAQAQTPIEPAKPMSQAQSEPQLEPQVASFLSVAERAAALERLAMQRRDNEAQQNEVMSKFDADIKGCEKKFTVTDCKLDVMAKKNAQMHDLKQVEHEIKSQERAIKAADKRDALQRRQSASELERKELQALEHEKAYAERLQDHEKALLTHDSKGGGIPLTPMSEDDLSVQATPKSAQSIKSLEEQTQAQAAYEKKVKEAIEHEAAVRKKLADKTNPAAALPAPELSGNRKALP